MAKKADPSTCENAYFLGIFNRPCCAWALEQIIRKFHEEKRVSFKWNADAFSSFTLVLFQKIGLRLRVDGRSTGKNCCFCRNIYNLRSKINGGVFPGAAGEPPRATALRGLAEAFPPPGVSVYFLRWYCIYYH